jgi:hypothetical protein
VQPHVWALGLTQGGAEKADLTVKIHSFVNYLKIINNKYPVITGPVQ